MKLVEILARGLTEWPAQAVTIKQNGSGTIFGALDESGDVLPTQIGKFEIADDCDGAVVSRQQWEEARDRLETSARNGQGLPPEGTICEANVPETVHRLPGVTGYAWRKVEVCKSGIPGAEGECLVYDLETTGSCWADEFRPLRTPEQIAAEEREAVIEQMIILDKKCSLSRTHFCGLLYDAGYRRQ